MDAPQMDSVQPAIGPRKPGRFPFLWVVVALIVVGGGCAVYTVLRHQGAPATSTFPSAGGKHGAIALAAGGNRLFYSVMDNEGGGHGTPQLYSVKSDGSEKKSYTHPSGKGYAYFQAVSPDGKKVAFTDGTDTERHLYISALDGSGKTEIGAPAMCLDSVSFTPDSARIVYRKSAETAVSMMIDMYLTTVDGTETVRLTESTEDERPWGVSADGTKVYYTRTINATDAPMEMDLATRKAVECPGLKIADFLAAPNGTTWKLDTKKTGKTMTIGVDGVDEQVAETVDELSLTPAGTTKSQPVARGFSVSVLGWAKE
jgi:hypothetical protein